MLLCRVFRLPAEENKKRRDREQKTLPVPVFLCGPLIVLAEHVAFCRFEVSEVFLRVDSDKVCKVNHFNHGVFVYGDAVLFPILDSGDLFFAVRVNPVVSLYLRAFPQLTQESRKMLADCLRISENRRINCGKEMTDSASAFHAVV